MPRRIDELFFDITARTDRLEKGVDRSKKKVEKLVATLTGPKGLVIGLAAAGVVMTAIAAKATRMAAGLDIALREVSTLLPQTVDQLGLVRKELIGLSTNVPQTPELLTKGLYQAISAGITDTTEAIQVLGVASRAAVAGLSDTFTSVDAITTVLNAYQLEANEAARVSDVFFATIREGKLTFGDIASNIGTVATSASLAGVSIEEVGAALATMTKFGVNSGEAANALNRFLLSVTQSTDDQVAAAKRLGIEWNTAALRSRGLVGFLQDLNEATNGNLDLLAEINPNIRASRAAFILAGQGAAEYGRILNETNNAQGAATSAFAKMEGALQNQTQLLKNQVNALWLELGSKILPLVIDAVTAVTRGLESSGERLARLYREIGEEQKAAEIELRAAEQRLAEEVEKQTKRVERALKARDDAFRESFLRNKNLKESTTGFGALGAALTDEESQRLLPTLADAESLEAAEALLQEAIEYGIELDDQKDLIGEAKSQLLQVLSIQEDLRGEVSLLIAEQERLNELRKPEDAELAQLKERRRILASGGPELAEEVAQIEKSIALRENEMALLRAKNDLWEQLTKEFAPSLEAAQARSVELTRQAASETGEVQRQTLAQRDEVDKTADAYQRVQDLERARLSIEKGITAETGKQNEKIAKLLEQLRELRATAADPLGEDFFLGVEIERTEEAINLLREGFLQLARLREGLVELEPPEAAGDADFEKFNLEAKALLAQRAIEQALRATSGWEAELAAVESILASIGIDADQLAPGFRQVIENLRAKMAETRGETDETKKKISEIVNEISFAARAGIELAAAFGLVGDEASQGVGQLALIGEGVAGIVTAVTSGDLLAGIGGVVSGLSGLIGGIFGGGPSPEEVARDESLRENNRRLRELATRMDLLRQAMFNIPGDLGSEVRDALATFADQDFGKGFGGALDRLEAFVGLRQEFEDRGLTAADVIRLNEQLGLDIDQLIRFLEGENLEGAETSEAINQARQFFEALNTGFEEAIDTLSGKISLLQRQFDVLDITDPVRQLELLVQALREAGTALSEDELQRIASGDEALIEEIFTQLAGGEGRFPDIDSLGSATRQELIDLISEIERIADTIEAEGGGEEGDFQNVSAINRLTVEQGDTLIALAGSRNFFLEEILEELRRVRLGGPLVTEGGLASADPQLVRLDVYLHAQDVPEDLVRPFARSLSSEEIDRALADSLRRVTVGNGGAPVRTI